MFCVNISPIKYKGNVLFMSYTQDELLVLLMFAKSINGFKDEFRWLSNFQKIDSFEYDGLIYDNVECFYVAMKVHKNNTSRVKQNQSSINLVEVNTREYISKLPPNKAKVFGRHVQIRHDWEDIKLKVMEYGLRIKFNQPKMKELLIATRDIEIFETNHWGDRYWGVDMSGVGENNLGKLIMKIRDSLSE